MHITFKIKSHTKTPEKCPHLKLVNLMFLFKELQYQAAFFTYLQFHHKSAVGFKVP